MPSGNYLVDAMDNEENEEKRRKKKQWEEDNWEDYWEPGDNE